MCALDKILFMNMFLRTIKLFLKKILISTDKIDHRRQNEKKDIFFLPEIYQKILFILKLNM